MLFGWGCAKSRGEDRQELVWDAGDYECDELILWVFFTPSPFVAHDVDHQDIRRQLGSVNCLLIKTPTPGA